MGHRRCLVLEGRLSGGGIRIRHRFSLSLALFLLPPFSQSWQVILPRDFCGAHVDGVERCKPRFEGGIADVLRMQLLVDVAHDAQATDLLEIARTGAVPETVQYVGDGLAVIGRREAPGSHQAGLQDG